MKELLVESVACLLVQKYGPHTPSVCKYLLDSFDAREFLQTADIRDKAQQIAAQADPHKDALFSRICAFLRYVSGQFLEEKKKQLLSTSRLRTVLMRREMAADFKRQPWALNDRKGLDKPWKPEGVTFYQSLP